MKCPLKVATALMMLTLALVAGCSNLDDELLSEKKQPRKEQRKEYRSPLQAAKECVDTLSNDPNKAEEWRKHSQTALTQAIEKLAPPGQDDLLRAAQAAIDHAYEVISASKDVEKNIVDIVAHAAKCAIQCRKASPEYAKSGTPLSQLQDIYNHRLLKSMGTMTSLASQSRKEVIEFSNRLFEDIRAIVEYGCIDTMLGKFHLTRSGDSIDQEATSVWTDRLFGKSSKTIAQEAARVWESEAVNKTSKVVSNPQGTDLDYKFDMTLATDRHALADVLKRTTILLVETLKAHYEHLSIAQFTQQ